MAATAVMAGLVAMYISCQYEPSASYLAVVACTPFGCCAFLLSLFRGCHPPARMHLYMRACCQDSMTRAASIFVLQCCRLLQYSELKRPAEMSSGAVLANIK